MKTIAVIGAGPAGSTAAERLAREGFRTYLLDEKLAWEKPCGGGVTHKACVEYPHLFANETPRRLVEDCELLAHRGTGFRFTLNHPVVIYSRRHLNQMLIDRAASAGADVCRARVTGAAWSGSEWRLQTSGGELRADFAVIATGARNPLRHLGTEWNTRNTMLAMGYYVPGTLDRIVIQFFPWLQGYVWLFPRGDHISAGICGKVNGKRDVRAELERWLDRADIPWRGSQFYAHLLPCLEPVHWSTNRLAGDGWLAVGDAGGLVDPVTGEGIYYAIRSGDLAAQALADERCNLAQKSSSYVNSVYQDFGADLELASKIARLFYLGETGLGSVPQRMIQFARRNKRIQSLLQDLMAGKQDYAGLRERLSDSISAKVFGVIVRYLRRSYEASEEVAS